MKLVQEFLTTSDKPLLVVEQRMVDWRLEPVGQTRTRSGQGPEIFVLPGQGPKILDPTGSTGDRNDKDWMILMKMTGYS